MEAANNTAELDYASIDARLLCVHAPRLSDARRAVASVKEAEAAWEILQREGFVPASFVEPGQRFFAGLPGVRMIERPYPISRDDAACIAAATDVIVVVEALARRIVAALELWGQPPPRKIVWTVLPPGKVKQRQLRGAYGVCDAMHLAALHAGHASAGDDSTIWTAAAKLSAQRGRSAAQHVFAHDVSMHESWVRAVRARATVPWGPYLKRLDSGSKQYVPVCIPRSLVGRSVADLPDPISPLLAIWNAGCVLDTVTDEAVLLHLPVPQ